MCARARARAFALTRARVCAPSRLCLRPFCADVQREVSKIPQRRDESSANFVTFFLSRLADGDPVQCWCLGAGPPRPQRLYYYKCQTGCESLFLTGLLCKEKGTRSKLSPCLSTSSPCVQQLYGVKDKGLSPCLSESSPFFSQGYCVKRQGPDQN